MTNSTPHETDRNARNFASVLIVGATLTAALACVSSHAEDSKVYSGGGCQAAYASQADRISLGTGGAVSNTSTQGAYVVCPVVRDKPEESWDWWSIYVRDRHPTSNISCTLRVTSNSGQLLDTVTVRTNGVGVFNHGSPNGRLCGPWSSCNEPPVYADASYAMRCFLPGRSGNGPVSQIISYNMIENT